MQMGGSKKPSRKKDLQKARSLLFQYKEHQDKVKSEPNSFAVEHWYREEETFLSQAMFYANRAGVELPDVD